MYRREKESEGRRQLCSRHQQLGSRYQQLGSRHQKLGSRHQQLGSRHQQLGSRHQQLGSRHQQLGSRHQQLGQSPIWRLSDNLKKRLDRRQSTVKLWSVRLHETSALHLLFEISKCKERNVDIGNEITDPAAIHRLMI